MKGISLAIETIIFIILGVTVLTVLLFFFTSFGGQSQHEFELQQQRHQWCGTYSKYNPTCERGVHDKYFPSSTSDTAKKEILEMIGQACKGLNVPGCTGLGIDNKASFECIQSCCLHCPERPVS